MSGKIVDQNEHIEIAPYLEIQKRENRQSISELS